MSCTLRIYQVNDVYELDNWPRFSTARNSSNAAHRSIGILPGDFVAPSLLSSLDAGQSQVDCMNASGIDYVCIGNHESDISLPALHARIAQSSFKWVNSNMRDLPLPAGMRTPEFEIVQVTGDDGHERRVAIIGLNTEDPGILRSGAFGGCSIAPIEGTAATLVEKLFRDELVDAVIPMTHQLMPLDRKLAEKGMFSVILGGHDHLPYLESVNFETKSWTKSLEAGTSSVFEGSGCVVVKTGIDGQKIAIIDITFPSKSSKSPNISVSLQDASSFPPCPLVSSLVARSKLILESLTHSTLFRISPSSHLTSKSARLGPSSIPVLLATVLRRATAADVFVLSAGSVRASKDYNAGGDEPFFTYGHLKAEMPFRSESAVVPLPGWLLQDVVRFSRKEARRTPAVEVGGFLQLDDEAVFDDVKNEFSIIGGEAFEPDKFYRVGIDVDMISGMDNNLPLIEFCKANSIGKPEGIGAKELIVSHFSKQIWVDILSKFEFGEIDVDGDGFIEKEELLAAAARMDTDREFTEIMIENLFCVADANVDGKISKDELQAVESDSIVKIHRKIKI